MAHCLLARETTGEAKIGDWPQIYIALILGALAAEQDLVVLDAGGQLGNLLTVLLHLSAVCYWVKQSSFYLKL